MPPGARPAADAPRPEPPQIPEATVARLPLYLRSLLEGRTPG